MSELGTGLKMPESIPSTSRRVKASEPARRLASIRVRFSPLRNFHWCSATSDSSMWWATSSTWALIALRRRTSGGSPESTIGRTAPR